MTQHADRVTLAERRARAINLRRGGASYRDIARQLGVSTTRAWELVGDALGAVEVDAVDRLRQIESERLDAAQMALWPRVATGDPRAVDAFVRLSARRARLLGLDLQPDTAIPDDVRDAYKAEFDRLLRGSWSLPSAVRP